MSDYIVHAGTPKHSGRYPWGSGENPYHHGQALPPRLKERRAAKKVAKDTAALEKSKQQLKNSKSNIRKEIASAKVWNAHSKLQRSKAKYTQLKEERLNKTDRVAKSPEEVDKIIRSGSPSKIYAYRKSMSNADISMAVKRLEGEKKLKDLSSQDKKSFLDKVDSVSKKVEKTGKIAKRFMGAYDAAAEVHNTFSKGNKWARVNKGQDNDQKKKDANAATFSKYANSLVKKSSKRKANRNGYDGPRLSDPYEDDRRNWR